VLYEDHTAVLILALDTTTRAGSVAVTRDDEVLAVVEGDPSRTHGERLPGEIDAALARSGHRAREIDLLTVASGPGAFTGLRIGLAAIQGLAVVLDIPVVGVSALDALAESARLEARTTDLPTVIALMDAQRGEVFGARYDPSGPSVPWTPASQPLVGPPAQLLEQLAEGVGGALIFVGDGAIRYREDIARRFHGAPVLDSPRALAPILARLGRSLAETGHAGPPHALQPLYVRRPDAELDRLRRRGQ
jgi:tRNA threonylcarbamoyladenosine biosynthesis protein TsaB